MDIVVQDIKIIDFENDKIDEKQAPETFSAYIKNIIYNLKDLQSVREYKTKSCQSEVIRCILDTIVDQLDTEKIKNNMNAIALRLLAKEKEAQRRVAHMDIAVQKGSLIQALLYDENQDNYIYLLAKVEHTDFIDDSDYSFKTGFSKDKGALWKSCIFQIDDVEAEEFFAKIYVNNTAKYWHEDFLELVQQNSDEYNTKTAFKAIDVVLNQNIKNSAPKDHMVIRNALIAYFKSHVHIDYDAMIREIIDSYDPVELSLDKKQILVMKLMDQPKKRKFDRQFNAVASEINAKMKSVVYDVNSNVQIKIIDAIDDLDATIRAYEDKGNRFIQIITDNEDTFKRFQV